MHGYQHVAAHCAFHMVKKGGKMAKRMTVPVELTIVIPAKKDLQDRITATVAWLNTSIDGEVPEMTPVQSKIWLEQKARNLLYAYLRRENHRREAEVIVHLDFEE